ncbi:Hcp family type VI secretion system effector [Vibrio parahaemolyticus]|nr:Hcp family type VI secretion system effector [Vibrio parahaemolyticus]
MMRRNTVAIEREQTESFAYLQQAAKQEYLPAMKWMMEQKFNHVVTVPTEPQSGQPSGRRVHKPFEFTVSLNKAVPLMYNALASGEKLKSVELKWYRTSLEGKQENFFTTKLENASIVDINCEMPHCQNPANADYTQNVTVSRSCRKITWDHINAGTSGADDWRKPIEA